MCYISLKSYITFSISENILRFNNFTYIEEFLYDKYKLKELFKVLVNFSIKVLNEYLPKIVNAEDVRAFYEEFEKAMKTKFKQARVCISTREIQHTEKEIHHDDSDKNE